MSARACDTAWKSAIGRPKARRAPAWATAWSSAASAIPTAKAPTLGRNRSSVRIAPGHGGDETAGEFARARLDQWVRAQTLQAEGRLGLGALPGQHLPQPAQFRGRDPVPARPPQGGREQPAEQPRLAQRPDQRA